ncbi:hypothetical protein AALO_G00244670 [Alosa alosa]|uniref:Uncharacterized protein n=1 Tax=Alosa alosa TaxID=278164 RepID=A0AAV6FVA7_9TELE|nr:hypothetical protein AALO_G00244670 [Alosa alosa]
MLSIWGYMPTKFRLPWSFSVPGILDGNLDMRGGHNNTTYNGCITLFPILTCSSFWNRVNQESSDQISFLHCSRVHLHAAFFSTSFTG